MIAPIICFILALICALCALGIFLNGDIRGAMVFVVACIFFLAIGLLTLH
jgi:hypothetical protein